MPERLHLKRSSWSSLSANGHYRSSLLSSISSLPGHPVIYSPSKWGIVLPQHVAPAHASRDLIVVAGLPDLQGRTATLVVPFHVPNEVYHTPFQDDDGCLVQELKHKEFPSFETMQRPSLSCPYGTLVVPQPLNRPFYPSTLPPFRGSLGSGSGSGSGTPPAANLFSVTFLHSPPLSWPGPYNVTF